ncbi:phage tail protein [Leeia sp. TBRC 13508]|uniref:Phage tail protein n=1 Tax=Leeia speluncae TaxID=2884804 RepID=A0ABS8D291_9NEIS|nr:phage tail protein [Leeia speluncae]MCB6182312.1 phage tail protein [Leeia speluncae]
MALKEYAGAVVLEVDGKEVEVVSVDPQVNTGRKLVKTMNRSRRAKGFARGIPEYTLKVTVPVDLDSEINWEEVEGAKLTIEPLAAGAKRISYMDCFSVDVGEKYTVDNEAVRDVTLMSLRKVEE